VVEITKKQDLEKIFQFEFFLMVVEKRRERVCGGSSFIINTVYLLISKPYRSSPCYDSEIFHGMVNIG
jgi:hypothetical protein